MKRANNYLYNTSQYLLPFSLFIGLGITKCINTAGNDVWISVILGSMLGLFIIFLLKKLPNKDNKVCSFICNLTLLSLGILVITKLISSVYLNKTNTLMLMFPFIVLLMYTGAKDEYSLFKVNSILTITYIIFILFAFSSLFPTINIDYFKPVLINPISKVLYGALEFALYSTVPLIVLPKFKDNYNYKVYLLSSLFLLIIFTLIIGNLGVELAKAYRYPEYVLFKNIAILDFIENTENILFFTWIINIYTLTGNCAINIKKIIGLKGLIFSLIIIAFIINKYIINNYVSLSCILNYFDYLLVGTFIIHVIGKLIGKKNHT